MKQKNNYLIKPILVALLFSVATVLLFEFGSYDYPNINRDKLYIFLLATNAAMLGGFYLGIRWRIPCVENNKRFPVEKLLRFLFWVALLSSIPKFAIFTGIYDFDLSVIVANVSKFFSNAQDIYAARQELVSVTGIWKYINYGVVLAGPFYWAYTPLALLFWDRLKKWRKIATLFIWGIYLLQYTCTGTNVGFFDFFITMWVVLVIKKTVFPPQNTKNKKARSKGSKNSSVLILTVAVLLLLVVLFGTVMGSRIGDQYLDSVKVGTYICPYDPGSAVNVILPSFLEPVAGYFTRYIAQAYNALAMSFDVPFDSTYGAGHSWFILDNLGSISDEVWERTYNMKLDHTMDYGYYGNWHTAYLWFANDVSHFGVPVVFLVLFTFFGRCWKEFLHNKNLFSFLVFMIFVKMMIFISANNQVFINSDTLFAFWLLVLALMFISRKYRWEDAACEV